MMLLVMFFFFFKQKTAYEMRISDWSSDVCSSDLFHCTYLQWCRSVSSSREWRTGLDCGETRRASSVCGRNLIIRCAREATQQGFGGKDRSGEARPCGPCRKRVAAVEIHIALDAEAERQADRSEEHTSELQSLMRITDAGFSQTKNKRLQKKHR